MARQFHETFIPFIHEIPPRGKDGAKTCPSYTLIITIFQGEVNSAHARAAGARKKTGKFRQKSDTFPFERTFRAFIIEGKKASSQNTAPFGVRSTFKEVNVEEKTKSGFILPASAQEKPQTCVVVAVGPGGVIDGKEVTMQVKVGDKVLCSKYAGTDFKVDGKEFTIIKQSDILAVVED